MSDDAITEIDVEGMDQIDEDEYETMYYIKPNDVLEYGLTVLVDADGTMLVPTDWQTPMPRTMADVPEADWVPMSEMTR